MTQISKYRLDKKIELEMFKHFWNSVSDLQDAETAASFFSDFLSHTEEIMLAKRFTIAILLLRDKTPIDIKNILHVSFSTIASVASWLKNGKPKTKLVLKKIIESQEWDALLDEISASLDDLPPVYGTNWKAAGQQRWQNKLNRATSKRLR